MEMTPASQYDSGLQQLTGENKAEQSAGRHVLNGEEPYKLPTSRAGLEQNYRNMLGHTQPSGTAAHMPVTQQHCFPRNIPVELVFSLHSTLSLH